MDARVYKQLAARRREPHRSPVRGVISGLDWRHCVPALALLAACQGAPVEPTAAARLEISPIDADVWLPRISIRGDVFGPFQAKRCEVEQDRRLRATQMGPASFRVQLELVPGINHVSARCFDATGRILQSNQVTFRNRTLRGSHDKSGISQEPRVQWIDDAIVYGMLPPLYGLPPLKAAANALPALADLGINAIWLSPVMTTTHGNFGYAVTDYFSVRQDYGTAADLKQFVDRAHSLRLKVLLDFVPNHTSDQHPYFKQAERFGARSHYFYFYQRAANGASQHYFDWKDLPNLDYANPEVAAFMTVASQTWLEDFGIDGYRVDAAWGIEQRQPEFYDTWTRSVRLVQPSAVLIAEASARDPFYLEHGFDAVYDWTNELGRWAWERVFEKRDRIAARLSDALVETAGSTRRLERVLRFLNNNDTGARFITRYGPDLTRVATVALLTLPGIPCLYSYDEVGGEFEPYGGLEPFHGEQHPELREFHRRLISLRRATGALHGSGFELLESENESVLAYLRRDDTQSPPVLVILNFSADPQRVTLQLRRLSTNRWLRDLLDPGRMVRAAELAGFSLQGFGYAILSEVETATGGRN